jgi:hypothetical protein
MALNNYEINVHSENFYWFTSSGPKGDVLKAIVLAPADLPAVEQPYNLGLADYVDGELSDKTVTDNKDTAKVMETVAGVILHYTSRFPERSIFVRGHTESRQRLYQMFASTNLEEIQEWFDIYGKEHNSEDFEPFMKGKIYEALLVERK